VAGISYVSGPSERFDISIPFECLAATDSFEQLRSGLESTVANETRVERVKMGFIGGEAGLPAKESTCLGAWECRGGERARPDGGPRGWC